jgi:hypothetical protein
MKLITLFPAFLLLVAPAHAQLVDNDHVMKKHGWTDAKDVPSLSHQWAEAPDLPFSPTKAGFKSYLENRYEFKVISLEGCKGTTESASVSIRRTSSTWVAASKRFQCDRVFYETTDPRGTQRCMGMFWFNSNGKAPDAYGVVEAASVYHGEKTLKNDCRWL